MKIITFSESYFNKNTNDKILWWAYETLGKAIRYSGKRTKDGYVYGNTKIGIFKSELWDYLRHGVMDKLDFYDELNDKIMGKE